LPKEVQELIKDKELIAGNDIPHLLCVSEPVKQSRTIEISKYDFMNDGFWIKYIDFTLFSK